MVHHTHLPALERKTADSSRRVEDGGRVGAGRDKGVDSGTFWARITHLSSQHANFGSSLTLVDCH